MSETKWPDGPYEISHEPPRWIIQVEQPLGKKALAWMVGDYLECRNIAHLFAASPDLYAAGAAILQCWDEGLFPVAHHVAALRAALSKARGES